jgi:chromosome partition protein MukE
VTGSSFDTLEAAILNELFPDVDLMLRRGRHIGRDDGAAYDYLVDAQPLLEAFYRRFGCELVQQSDGYFYLLPSGDRLGRRQLSAGEMLVGQTLALLYLDPATLQHGGLVSRAPGPS